jgi:hypothetical protein
MTAADLAFNRRWLTILLVVYFTKGMFESNNDSSIRKGKEFEGRV